MQAAGATIENSTFQGFGAGAIGVRSNAAGTDLTLRRNVFLDSSTDEDTTRGAVLAADAVVDNSDFEDFYRAIEITGGSTIELAGTGFQGVSPGPGGIEGTGIHVAASGLDLLIEGASFSNPAPGATTGIDLTQSGPQPLSATMRRIRVVGHQTGMNVTGTTGSVSLESSLLAANSLHGLEMHGEAGGADVTATNLTALDNGDVLAEPNSRDILNYEAQLTLDSSIVGNGVNTSSGSSCQITFSRGPSTGTGCSGFQTTVDPAVTEIDEFGDFDYSLDPGSPMIDAGNPQPPEITALDIGRDPRAVDGTPSCAGADVPRRDIGADEFVPIPPDCTPDDLVPPVTEIRSGPKRVVKSKAKRAKATFEFGASEPATFECSLDAGAFKPCASPLAVKVRAKPKFKRHELRVRATDSAGNVEAVPASYAWKVKRKPKRRP